MGWAAGSVCKARCFEGYIQSWLWFYIIQILCILSGKIRVLWTLVLVLYKVVSLILEFMDH